MASIMKEESSSLILLLPPEVRDLVYTFALEEDQDQEDQDQVQPHFIHVVDTNQHRSAGSPNRPKHRAQLPALVHVNRQIRRECLPAVARRCTLVFYDYVNLARLIDVVPWDFAVHVRRIRLRGGSSSADQNHGQNHLTRTCYAKLRTKFPSLRQVSYQQLGSCFYPPLRQNGFNKQAMKAKQADLVHLIREQSPALGLLEDELLFDPSGNVKVNPPSSPSSPPPPTPPIRLIAEASVLSFHERVQVWVDVNANEIICRRLLGVHRLYDYYDYDEDEDDHCYCDPTQNKI